MLRTRGAGAGGALRAGRLRYGVHVAACGGPAVRAAGRWLVRPGGPDALPEGARFRPVLLSLPEAAGRVPRDVGTRRRVGPRSGGARQARRASCGLGFVGVERALLAPRTMALDPTSHPNASAQRFEGLAGRLPQPSVSPCPPRPKLQGRVVQATKVEEVTFPSLLRLCLWYDKPLVVCCLANTPFRPVLRSIFLKVTEPFLDRAVFVLAEDPDLYEYAITQHINTLKGTRVAYYADHAMRALNPTDSFNWDPINHRLDDQAGITKFLEDRRTTSSWRPRAATPSCPAPARRARRRAGRGARAERGRRRC
ncbi:unnamed protein product [Prorocentrum cordatum]|uniref:Uncharacterized protein n=1 Tax=Prorocentrum cordatum TaxID=2364126 RepID=A0ABN9SC59_9DINO|nr:unnamed protein product [Polarella glacialis]